MPAARMIAANGRGGVMAAQSHEHPAISIARRRRIGCSEHRRDPDQSRPPVQVDVGDPELALALLDDMGEYAMRAGPSDDEAAAAAAWKGQRRKMLGGVVVRRPGE